MFCFVLFCVLFWVLFYFVFSVLFCFVLCIFVFIVMCYAFCVLFCFDLCFVLCFILCFFFVCFVLFFVLFCFMFYFVFCFVLCFILFYFVFCFAKSTSAHAPENALNKKSRFYITLLRLGMRFEVSTRSELWNKNVFRSFWNFRASGTETCLQRWTNQCSIVVSSMSTTSRRDSLRGF